MDVALGEEVGIHAEFVGLAADVARGGLGAFLHDVAEGAGELDGALALHDGGLDGEHVAAGLGPGEAVGHAGQELLAPVLLKEDGRAQKLGQVGCAHMEGRIGALGLPAGHLAAEGADLALQLAHARLAGVLEDDALDGRVLQLEVALLEAVVVHALLHEVAPGYLELLLLGVAGEPDDFGAVAQGAGDGLQLVGRAQEDDLGEIEGHAQVVVGEGGVLLGIEHLKQGGLGIAVEVVADLVQLVQHDHGVARAGVAEALDDAARHGADVGAPVAADLGLVVHAAEAEALELPAEGPGNAAAERGLAHAWRADEAEYGALGVGIELVDAQVFKDAVLDLVEAEVVLVQGGLGVLDVQVVLGELVPGQLAQQLEIGADDARLRRVAVGEGEAAELLVGLLLHVLGQMGLLEGLAQALGLACGILAAVAELLVDGLDLLAQEVVLLLLVHLLLGGVLDAQLHGRDLGLAGELVVDELEPLDRIYALEDVLGVLELEPEARGHEVGKASGLVDVLDDVQELGRGDALHGEHLLALLPGKAQHGLDVHVDGDFRLGQNLHAGAEEGLLLGELHSFGAGLAVDEDLELAVGKAEHAQHLDDGADAEEVLRPRLVVLLVALGEDEHVTAFAHGVLHGLGRRGPADEERQEHEVEDDHVAHGHHGHDGGNGLLLLLLLGSLAALALAGGGNAEDNGGRMRDAAGGAILILPVRVLAAFSGIRSADLDREGKGGFGRVGCVSRVGRVRRIGGFGRFGRFGRGRRRGLAGFGCSGVLLGRLGFGLAGGGSIGLGSSSIGAGGLGSGGIVAGGSASLGLRFLFCAFCAVCARRVFLHAGVFAGRLALVLDVLVLWHGSSPSSPRLGRRAGSAACRLEKSCLRPASGCRSGQCAFLR